MYLEDRDKEWDLTATSIYIFNKCMVNPKFPEDVDKAIRIARSFLSFYPKGSFWDYMNLEWKTAVDNWYRDYDSLDGRHVRYNHMQYIDGAQLINLIVEFPCTVQEDEFDLGEVILRKEGRECVLFPFTYTVDQHLTTVITCLLSKVKPDENDSTNGCKYDLVEDDLWDLDVATFDVGETAHLFGPKITLWIEKNEHPGVALQIKINPELW